MSSLEKRQASRRGSTHGPRKCSDGISDTSSVGSFMDDTDREVSSLTDRAFRSLCIGEDAVYNDMEVSSPADQHTVFAQEALQKNDLRTTCQEFSSHGIQCEETERKPEVASTFQHSCVVVAQEHVFREKSLSYISNGCMEGTWQQKRSTSRVSSLIKDFSSGENYCDSGAPDTVQDKYQDFNNKLWNKSALLSVRSELSEINSGYNTNFKSGSLQSHGNNFHAVARMNTATSSKTKFKALNTNNLFFHSEFSPFQLWKDYNRFPFERDRPSGVVSTSGFPRWYDSALYKELTATHRILSSPAEGKQFTQRKIEDIAASQCPRSTVIQKASAIEKRCESEMASNCPPWKNNNFVKSKLPSNRPSTVSPTNEKVHRPDSSLLYHSRNTLEIQNKVGRVGSSEMSNRTTPFNITQLLTPVIPVRQETETSEILQFAHTPLGIECDSDLKAQSDVKQLRDTYKSKASSLLFNLKDNRKRVKSTYSPTKFKISEISDRNKQASKQEGRESRLSETSGSKVPNQEHTSASAAWELCNPVQTNSDLSLLQTTEHKWYADKSPNSMTLVSRYGNTNSNISHLGSQNSHPDSLTNREREHYELLTYSGHGSSGGSPVGHINDSMRTFGTKPEKEKVSKAQLPAHLSADMSVKQTFFSREDEAHQNFKEGKNFVKKASIGYINKHMKEMVNNNEIQDALPYKGEIATMIEMDKQRKVNAKQYLPLVNESYTMRKEICTNKVNENVNRSWLPKDKQIQDTESSFQKYTEKCFSKKQVKDDHTTTPATSEHFYEFQHNGLQKMADNRRRSEITTYEKAEDSLQRNIKHATSDIETAKDYSPRTQFLQSVEEKYLYNEGSVAYQPYKYELNKQWHIATTENRHNKGEECMSRQLQHSEIKTPQQGESNYAHSRSRTSCTQQQNTADSARPSQRNWITEDRAKTIEHKPTSQVYKKQSHMNTGINVPNTQTSQNSSQARVDRFNINDILSVRDSEQAKRIRENKSGFNSRVGDPTKLENLTSPVTSDVAEDIAAISEPSKLQSRAQQDGNSQSKHGTTKLSNGYVRKESHIPNDVKERLGKDIFINNENDKFTLRALSYKEKGQTKHEMLTSKLKAHAQKEISAIKEKGLAKHAIPSRNPIKQSSAISNDKGQIIQEVLSPQKEITAEKLNHLFQDITYSSVSLYKEQRNQGKDEPKNESLTAEKVESLTRDPAEGSETDKVTTEKERTNISVVKYQEVKTTDVDKKNCEAQKFVKNYVHQSNMQSKENQLIKPSTNNEKQRSTYDYVVSNGTNPAQSFSRSPNFRDFNNEESIVKKEDKTSANLPKTCTSNDTEYSSFKQEVLVKTDTNHRILYNISGEALTLERSVNKAKEQLSNVNTAKPTVDSSQKCYDLAQATKSKDDKRKESTLANARELEINTRQDETPTDWMKDDVPAVEKTMEFIETAFCKTAVLNKQTVNTEQISEHLQSGASENQTVLSEILPKASNQMYCKPNTEPIEKETWLEQVNIQAEAKLVKLVKTNEDASLQQLQHTEAHARKDLGSQTNLSLNKPVRMKLDSSEEYRYSPQPEPQTKQPNSENSELQKTVSQLQLNTRQENQNQQLIRDKEINEDNNQQLQDIESDPDTEHHTQKAKDFQEHKESTPMETKQSNDDIRINNSDTLPCSEHEKSEEKIFMPNITINSEDQQLSGHPAKDQSADVTNPVPESHVIHIASKEDSSPTNEPVIYSICVSSTSEAVSEDEPIIYSISVSSLSDASIIPGPENQESDQKQLSVEQAEKDDRETFGSKNKESEFRESKEESKDVKLILNNKMAEEETVVRKCDSPTSKDKLDYYRSTEVDNISSTYKSLSAKYGLPNGDTIHVESDQKEQDKNQGNEKDEKEESIHNALQKTQNNTIDKGHSPVENLTSADFTKKHSPESRKSKSPEDSPELLRNADKTHEQNDSHSEQEHEIANEGCTPQGDEVSDRNTKEDVSANQEVPMSKVVPVCEDFMDTLSAKQIKENGNVQLKENKQVEQNVQKMETGQNENDIDVVNKNAEMVQVKCETDSQLTPGFNSSNINNNSLKHTCDDSSQLSSKVSTNDCQISIKTQNTGLSSFQSSQNAINQTGNTKSPTLKYRTPEECVVDALKQEIASTEHLQSKDKTALQKNRKEMVSKSKFPELEQAKFMKSNKVNVSRVKDLQKEILNFNNEQTKENSSSNQNQIEVLTAGKTDQSVFTQPDIPMEDKEVHKNDIKSQIKTVCTSIAAPPNRESENDQNKTSANVIGTKASSALGMTADDIAMSEKEKWKRKPTQKEREMIRDEVMPLNKDSKTASSVIKGNKDDAECESCKSEKNLKEAKAQPRSSGKVLRDKHDQLSNVYKPENEALPEKKGNKYDGKNTFESNPHSKYHDTVLSKQEKSFTKSEVTHREKKMTRPEISALADYARLRVISAEDDTITEKDLLQKMNTNQKYNLKTGEPQKANSSICLHDTEQSKQPSVNKISENLNATTPLRVHERRTYKITDEKILAGHQQCLPRDEMVAYPKVGSLAKSSDDRVCTVKDTESTKEKTLTNHIQSNTKRSLTAQEYRYSRSHEVHQPQNPQAPHAVHTQIESKNEPKTKQSPNANMLERKVYPQVKNSQWEAQVSVETELNKANRHSDNQIKVEVKDEETSEELQYYIVNAIQSETKPKNNHEAHPLIFSKKDLTEIPATASRSNTSSPAMGKPILFRVKDNTGKTSSVTKTVRPCFHRSFSEDFGICSPVDSYHGSEKLDYDNENNPKESATSPVLQSVTSHQLSSAKEIQARNRLLSPGFMAPREPRSYNRRSHVIAGDESRSLISSVSDNVQGLATSSVGMTNSRDFDTEHVRRTYARPESSCYERPESACYERPESACSDMRPASKPPSVPPKTEKALRRAKRLTSRRTRQEEDKMSSDTQVQSESKSIRTVSSLPASPMVQMSTSQTVQASPPISHYHVEPNYAPSAPTIVAHSFPMTQRKFLQDPNSGQIFMVDMPVQVKTKTFFDPETGKYLQLNVRQKAQSTLSQPASLEVLGHPYVVYPGFLPMSVSVSSVPSVRSSSQMSAPATLTEDLNRLKASHEPSEQEIFERECHRNVQQHNRPVYRTCEQTGRESLHNENVRMTPRQTHIITMSELEDFAIENT